MPSDTAAVLGMLDNNVGIYWATVHQSDCMLALHMHKLLEC